MSKIILNFAREVLAEVVKRGGELVEPETAQRRIEICRGCGKVGIVEPLPFIKMEGCTVCGCPLATKPHMKTVIDIHTLSFTIVECPLKKWDNLQ